MSIEVNTVGRRCGVKNGGLECVYCFLPLSARKEAAAPPIDHERIQESLLIEGGKHGHFSLHGGEPLLTPLEDLEKLWAFGLEKWDRNGVQTSGRPIREEHYKYRRRGLSRPKKRW